MGWDGAGGYTRQHNFSADASAGIKILAARMDAELDDVASAITLAWARNGQNVPTQAIPMGGQRFINVGAATSVGNYMRVREFVENVPIFMQDVESSADRISVSAQYFTSVSANQNPGDGTKIIVRANSNKSSAVLYLNGNSANVNYAEGGRIASAITSGGLYEFTYSSTQAAWHLNNPDAIASRIRYERTAAEIAAGVTPTSYQYEPGDVRRYGADTTGVSDCVSAFNAAIDVAAAHSTGGGLVYAPTGVYRFNSTVAIDVDRVKIRGDGPRNTEFWFYPTANDTLFAFGTGATQQEQAGISECSILSSDSTYEKVAIETSDGSNFTIENVEIGGTVAVDSVNTWSGGASGSIGLRVLGRETLLTRNLYIVADRPVYIGVNPNFSTIHTDHFNFHNLYLIGNDYPLVEVDPGVNITDMSFTGSQPWVKGTNAFKWNATTTTISNTLVFENVGTEQFTGTTEFAFDIQANATGYLQNLYFKNCEVESTRYGLKGRNVQRITIDNTQFAGGSGITNLDITFVSLTELHLRNTLVQAASTVTLTNGVFVEGSAFTTALSAIPRTALYIYDQTAVISQRHRLVGQGFVEEWEYTATLADNATLSLPWLRASHTHCTASVKAYSATGPVVCNGIAEWSKDGTTSKTGGTANFVVAAVGAGELRVLDGGSGLVVINALGQDVTLTVKTWGK